jgi:hypothetical protein
MLLKASSTLATALRDDSVLHHRKLWVAVAVVVSLGLFLSTLQIGPNGSQHPYATDVGEIQNALPRWGILHDSGYPLYAVTGSLFVAVLRAVGVAPAAGASLFSALFGAATVGLAVALIQEMGIQGPIAALSALAVAISTSVWVDSSLAEVHTLTLAFTAATLLFALRFGQTGRRRDFLLLTLLFTQGVGHQRAVALLAPAILLLMWPQLREVWRSLGYAVLLALLTPLVYVYMPLRVWTGVTWTYGSPGTWEGFLAKALVDQTALVVVWPEGVQEWLSRGLTVAGLLADDLLWPVLFAGLVGLAVLVFTRARRVGVALTLAWVPYVPLALIIWEYRVSDALLAVKLPVVLLAGVGLAALLDWLGKRARIVGALAAAVLAVTLLMWAGRTRPFVLAITRDPYAEGVIAKVEQLMPLPEDRQTTLAVLWGHDYWALAYAQECEGRFEGLNLVDHNAYMRVISEESRMLTLDGTFLVSPISWWEEQLGGRLHLASAAPDIVEFGLEPPVDPSSIPSDVGFDLGNGLRVRSATVEEGPGQGQLHVTIYWEATGPVSGDYSVAVHLVSVDPPQGREDILDQADTTHPVENWYPTSQWSVGEVVRDDHVLDVPAGSSPVAVRIAMYQVDDSGTFVNTEWLSLAIPQ